MLPHNLTHGRGTNKVARNIANKRLRTQSLRRMRESINDENLSASQLQAINHGHVKGTRLKSKKNRDFPTKMMPTGGKIHDNSRVIRGNSCSKKTKVNPNTGCVRLVERTRPIDETDTSDRFIHFININNDENQDFKS